MLPRDSFPNKTIWVTGGADVVALTVYVKQRLELVHGHITALPADLQPPARSPYW